MPMQPPPDRLSDRGPLCAEPQRPARLLHLRHRLRQRIPARLQHGRPQRAPGTHLQLDQGLRPG